MYELNYDWIESEVKKVNKNQDSDFINAILDYDDPLPELLCYLFKPWSDIPSPICRQVQRKHGDNWNLHIRTTHFMRGNESHEECDNRLIRTLLKKTRLPIYIEK